MNNEKIRKNVTLKPAIFHILYIELTKSRFFTCTFFILFYERISLG